MISSTGPVAASCTWSYMATKRATATAARLARPSITPACRAASSNVVPVRSAYAMSAPMVDFPIPRAGVLMIRKNATLSRRLFSRCRYARMSLISLRW